jgi:hypothetical protein
MLSLSFPKMNAQEIASVQARRELKEEKNKINEKYGGTILYVTVETTTFLGLFLKI